MTDQTDTGTSEQPPVIETAAPASEQQQAGESASPSFENASLDELFDAIDAVPSEPSQEAEPAALAVVEEPVAPAAETETAADTEQAPAAETEKNFRRRLSTNGVAPEAAQQAAAAFELIRQGKAADLFEAAAILKGEAIEPATAGQEEVQAPTATPPTTAKVDEIKSRIEDLRAQRDKADEDFDRPAFRKLTSEIEDAQLDLIRAETAAKEETAKARKQAVQASKYNERYEAAVEEVEAAYPEQTADENSAFNRFLDDRVIAAKARRDPRLKDPAFIKVMADELAAELGIKKGGTPAKPTATAAPARPSRPVGSSLAPGHQTAARPTRDQIQRGIDNLSADELAALADSL